MRMRPPGFTPDGLIAWLPKSVGEAVEVGAYAGEFSECLLRSGKCSKVWAVDPWVNDYDPRDGAGGSDMMAVEAALDRRLSRWLKSGACQKIRKASVEASKQFGDGTLGFVYIDACHTYDAVRKDLEVWLPKLREDGVMAGHDWVPATWPGVVQAVREVLGEPDQFFVETSWAVMGARGRWKR